MDDRNRQLGAKNATTVIVRNDNDAVVRWFGGGRAGPVRPKKQAQAELVAQTIDMATDAGLVLVASWVKGHSSKRTTAAYLNTQVDQMARRARVEKLAYIRVDDMVDCGR